MTTKRKPAEAGPEFLLRGMSYPSGLYQAAMLNCESFAFTFFASTTELPQS